MYLKLRQYFTRISNKSDFVDFIEEIDLQASAQCNWMVESGHFTMPYPLPSKLIAVKWIFGTMMVGRWIEDVIQRDGAQVKHGILLGDMAYEPGLRSQLLNAALPVEIKGRLAVLESVARNKGKRLFNRYRHRMKSTEDVQSAFELSGGIFCQKDGSSDLFFTADSLYSVFNQSPSFTQVSAESVTVPLCPLIIAGKYLVFMENMYSSVFTIYDRREDIAIRSKNLWGAALALYLRKYLYPESPPVAIWNLTIAGQGAFWLDHLTLEPRQAESAPTVGGVLADIKAIHPSTPMVPYIHSGKK